MMDKRLTTKESIEQYLKVNEIKTNLYPLTNGKIFAFEELKKKLFFDWEEEDFIAFFFDFVKINSYDTLSVYRTRYTQFLHWALQNHLLDRENNIFEGNVQLDPDTLAAYMSVKANLFYYNDDYIDAICKNIQTDQIYSETLIRCFYEGISSFQEIIYLKKNMVDPKKKVFHLKDRMIPISDRLLKLLQQIMSDELEGETGDSRRRIYYRRFEPEDVFPYRSTKSSERNRTQYMQRRLEMVKKELNLDDLSIKKLYQSGLLQYIYKACGRDMDRFILLLYEDKRKQTNAQLDRMLQEGGYQITSYRVRSLFKPYMIQVVNSRS